MLNLESTDITTPANDNAPVPSVSDGTHTSGGDQVNENANGVYDQASVQMNANADAQKNLQKPIKKKHTFRKILIGIIVVVAVLIIIGECGGDDSNGGQKTDLTEYIGQPLRVMESKLGIKFKDMTQYFENTYRIEEGSLLCVDCVVNDTGKVVKVILYNSGKKQYSIKSVLYNTSVEDAKNALSTGCTYIRGNYWSTNDGADLIYHDGSHWIYEKNSDLIEEQVFRAECENSFTPQFEDSVGMFWLGNGQILEYVSDSFVDVVYSIKQMTDYQANELCEQIDGKYVIATGEVTGVSSSGEIILYCKDDNADPVAFVLPTGMAKVTVLPDQKDLISGIDKGDIVTVIGRFDGDSRSGILSGDTFDLYDSIIYSIGSKVVDIPIIQKKIPGITVFKK